MQEKLNGIKDYFQSMELLEGKWVICVKYKEKWGAYPSEDGSINAIPDEKAPDVYWYFPTNDNVGIDEIIALIEETIATNLDAIKKADLFKEKALELKKLFADDTIPFSKLQTLYFGFADITNVKSSRKTAKKSKPKTKKEIISEAVEEVEEPRLKEETNMVLDEQLAKPQRKNATPTPSSVTDSTEAINATELSDQELNDLRG